LQTDLGSPSVTGSKPLSDMGQQPLHINSVTHEEETIPLAMSSVGQGAGPSQHHPPRTPLKRTSSKTQQRSKASLRGPSAAACKLLSDIRKQSSQTNMRAPSALKGKTPENSPTGSKQVVVISERTESTAMHVDVSGVNHGSNPESAETSDALNPEPARKNIGKKRLGMGRAMKPYQPPTKRAKG